MSRQHAAPQNVTEAPQARDTRVSDFVWWSRLSENEEAMSSRTRLWDIKTPWTVLLKSGDSASLERLLNIYREPLFAFFRAQGLGETDAEDITQMMLMDFFLVRKNHKAVSPERGRFRAYLLTAARNTLRDWKRHARAIRRGGNEPRISIERMQEEWIHWEPAGGKSPDEEYEIQWARATWSAALDLFRSREPASLASVLELFYTQRLSQSEAARQLGISVPAFNSRLFNGRRKLFACVSEIVRATLDDPSDLDSELERLRDLLRSWGL